MKQAKSQGEESFWLQLQARGIASGWVREHKFAPVRRWRFDFAHLKFRLCVEVEGAARGGVGRHSYASSMAKDFEKYNMATLMGWKIYRGTTEMAVDGRLAEIVEEALRNEQRRDT